MKYLPFGRTTRSFSPYVQILKSLCWNPTNVAPKRCQDFVSSSTGIAWNNPPDRILNCTTYLLQESLINVILLRNRISVCASWNNFWWRIPYFNLDGNDFPPLSTMGVRNVFVGAGIQDDGNNFAAVNLALEVDQADLRARDFKKNVIESDYSQAKYAETILCSSGSSDGDERDGRKISSSSDSTSDSNSATLRAESPFGSDLPGASHSAGSANSSEVLSSSRAASPVSMKTSPASTMDGRDETKLGIQIETAGIKSATTSAAKPYIPPLLSFKEGNKAPERGRFLQFLYNVWTQLKALRTAPRDARALTRYIKLKHRMYSAKRADLNVPTAFDNTTAKHPDKVAFYFEEETWTFAQVQAYSQRVAQVFRGRVQKGDAVALLMENRVEYIAVWLGLARLGAVPALLNTNLRLRSLSHCITSADCKMVVCGSELQDVLLEIRSDIPSLPVYVSGAGERGSSITVPGALNLDALQSAAPAVTPPEQADVHFADKVVYIYTSGTTGLPKAAVITHSRFIVGGVAMLCFVGITPEDVLYCPLPLYHSSGGNIGVGMTICYGVTLALRKKFSVRAFFPDCNKYGCTVGQYIGEICRYLLNSPPCEADRQHKVRVMFGNGLRPQIWEQFQERFGVPRISEFYGSTEGNANIINMDGRVGAVGFLSVLIPAVYPCALIKIDPDTGAPLRNTEGLCYRCKPGEPGEFVGLIIPNDPLREFKGYADKKATNKKIIHNVFKREDSAFLSGDLLVMDEEGYLYFKDRTGDTFRWKGENVSTAEVENHLSAMVHSTDVSVYGVEVPNTEGRAGMAAVLDPDGGLVVDEVAAGVTTQLPGYARPLFLRTVKHMDMTGTYKLRKTELQKEGYDITAISDPVYLLDTKAASYRRLDHDLYRQIIDGKLRL